jgi:hypothetical protein
MPSVVVTILPWLSEHFGSSRTFFFESQMRGSESILDLLLGLAEKNVSFRKDVFGPSGETLQSHILVVLNGKLVTPTDISSIKVGDGDRITLAPAHTGG